MRESNEPRLLPCLHCNSLNIKEQFDSETDSEFVYFVQCFECSNRTDYYEHRLEARDAWNRRPAPQQKDALIAELLEALEEAEETIEADIEECRDFRAGFGKDGCEECKRYKECDRWIRIRKVRLAVEKAKECETLL